MNIPFYFNDVFDTNILSTINSTEGRVYMAYLRYSNGGRDVAYPSQAHLAWSLGVDPKTIGRAVKVLQKKKFIVQVRSGKGGQSTKASEYTVKTPAQLGYFPKKRANQAPVPPAPVPVPAKQPKPQPAPAAAPAQSPTDSVGVNAPDSSLKANYVMKHKTEEGITAVEAFELAKLKNHYRVANIDKAEKLDEYFFLLSGFDNEKGNYRLAKFWEELQAM